MLTFQRSNSFEQATFLTSLLLGQGYNAFVVNGYASKAQTERDLTLIPCPYLEEPDEPPPVVEQLEIPKYKLKLPPDLRSQFQLELETEEYERLEREKEAEEEERRREIEELEEPPLDEHHGWRVHAWVVLLPEEKGLRDIQEPIFIEPSTGKSYEPSNQETDRVYLGIESIWNDRNYWVNVQPRSKGCSDINWDLTNTNFWEHLLPGEPWTMRGDEEQPDEDITVEQEKHLDMPASYVKPIEITSEAFERRYPNGTRTEYYKKVRLELFAPYVQLDGLVQRITLYEDYDYQNPIEVQEKYSNRSDKLVESRRNLIDDSIVDRYERGRLDRCKEHRYFATGSETGDTERILEFFHKARTDGLSMLEMHPEFLTQHYQDREDLLYYRKAQYSLRKSVPLHGDAQPREIFKITEKYGRNEKLPGNKDVAIREFAIGENETRLIYHYNPGQCSRATRAFAKPPLAERGDRLVFDPSKMRSYSPDPTAEPERSLDLFYELEKHLNEEDRSISEIRAGEAEVSSFLKTRRNEYLTPDLLISEFDGNRLDLIEIKEEKIQSQRDLKMTEEMNRLGPYLARLGKQRDLSNIEKHILREQCLQDYKQSFVRRANKILRKFEYYTKEMTETRQLLQGEDLTKEEEEQILDKMNEINFNLHTLEIRMNRLKEQARIRYKKLMDKLQSELSVL